MEREYTKNFRYPKILPSKHPVVARLTLHYHVKNCHIGTQGLLSLLRENFWIIRGRKTIKNVLLTNRKILTPVLPLPKNSVVNAAIFEITGVDLAGLLYVRKVKV